MKKFYSLILAAVALFGFAACTQDVDVVNGDNKITVYASFENVETRLRLNGYTPTWESGDEITINDIVFYTAAGGENALFTSDLQEGEEFPSGAFKAVYPAKGALAIAKEQTARVGSFAKNIPVVAAGAKFEEGLDLSFKNVAALLRVRAYTAGDITFKAVGGEKLANDFTINDDATVTFSTTSKTASDVVTLKGCEEGNIYYVAVAPVTLSQGLEITVGGETISGGVGMELKRNTIYDLGVISEHGRGISCCVRGTHNDWGNTMATTPMYAVDGHYVAYDVEFTGAECKFKFENNGTWTGVADEQDVFSGNWCATGGNDIVIEAGVYDIYFQPNAKAFRVVEAGSEVAPYSVSLIGIGGDWETDLNMTLDGDFYVYEDLTLAEASTFKVRVNGAWIESYGFATEGDTSVFVDEVNSFVLNGNNAKLEAGTYDIYFDMTSKEFYALTGDKTPADVDVVKYRVYVYCNNNDWEEIALYAWTDNGANYFGDWPGATTTNQVTYGDYTYKVWTLPASAVGQDVKVILNNNNKGSQTGNFQLGKFEKDFYLLLNGAKISIIEDRENVVIPEVDSSIYTWGLVGQHNGWTITDPTPMYPTDTEKLYVCKGITLQDPGFKFAKQGLSDWNGANTYFGAKTSPAIGTWYTGVYDNNLGEHSNNIGVSDYSKTYDIYIYVLQEESWGQQLAYLIVEAGTEITLPQ